VSLEPIRRVVVELAAGTGPIAGTLREEDGAARPFSGWLELCALLQAARVSGEPADGREALLP
jgi:hypothetical protein